MDVIVKGTKQASRNSIRLCRDFGIEVAVEIIVHMMHLEAFTHTQPLQIKKSHSNVTKLSHHRTLTENKAYQAYHAF